MDDKRMLAAAKQAVYYRNYRRARDRALVRLAQAYPDEYAKLLEEEKERDDREGKTWLDIHGRTNRSATAAGYTAPNSARDAESQQASGDYEEDSKLG